MTDLFGGWLNLQKKHLKREFTVRRRVKKINLGDLFLNSSQKGGKLKKVTQKSRLINSRKGSWCISKKGKRKQKEVVNDTGCYREDEK